MISIIKQQGEWHFTSSLAPKLTVIVTKSLMAGRVDWNSKNIRAAMHGFWTNILRESFPDETVEARAEALQTLDDEFARSLALCRRVSQYGG